MVIPEGYLVVAESYINVPVELNIVYGNVEKGDFKITITATEHKKETTVEVLGLLCDTGNIEEDGIMLILNIPGVTKRPIVNVIDNGKAQINRVFSVAEHITNFIGKLASENHPADKVLIMTPYRGAKNKDYDKTVVNVSLMGETNILDHLSCAFTITPKYMEYMEKEIMRILTSNRFRESF